MIKSENVSRFDMTVDIFDLNKMRHFRQTEMTTDRVDQLFLFDGLTPATWFTLRIQYRLFHHNSITKTDIATKQELIFKTKDDASTDDSKIDNQIIFLESIVSKPDQLDVTIGSTFSSDKRIKIVVIPELILCDRGAFKANGIQLAHNNSLISFDLKNGGYKSNRHKHDPKANNHNSCSTLCIHPYIKARISNKEELFRGKAWCGTLEQAYNQLYQSNNFGKQPIPILFMFVIAFSIHFNIFLN
uniref:Uncharacterized protein n=1 Tax=Rhabditophanes sp. KR3021 TaxID=114890 RepID=A0AC35U502_9BILA